MLDAKAGDRGLFGFLPTPQQLLPPAQPFTSVNRTDLRAATRGRTTALLRARRVDRVEARAAMLDQISRATIRLILSGFNALLASPICPRALGETRRDRRSHSPLLKFHARCEPKLVRQVHWAAGPYCMPERAPSALAGVMLRGSAARDTHHLHGPARLCYRAWPILLTSSRTSLRRARDRRARGASSYVCRPRCSIRTEQVSRSIASTCMFHGVWTSEHL